MKSLAKDSTRATRLRTLAIALGVLLGALALEWLWRAWLGEAGQRLLASLADIRDSRLEPVIVIGGFVLAELAMMPVTILIVAIALAFAPLKAFAYAVAGATLSAVACFAIGRALGRETIRRLAGARANLISEHLARRGVLAVTLLRMLPIGPFTLGNLVAGASHLRLRDFTLGTIAGMSPGIIAIIALAHGAVAALRNPTPLGVALLALPVAALIAAIYALRRMLRQVEAGHSAQAEVGDDPPN